MRIEELNSRPAQKTIACSAHICQEKDNPNATHQQLHNILLMMREAWQPMRDRFKARNISFSKFNAPYQQVSKIP